MISNLFCLYFYHLQYTFFENKRKKLLGRYSKQMPGIDICECIIDNFTVFIVKTANSLFLNIFKLVIFYNNIVKIFWNNSWTGTYSRMEIWKGTIAYSYVFVRCIVKFLKSRKSFESMCKISSCIASQEFEPLLKEDVNVLSVILNVSTAAASMWWASKMLVIFTLFMLKFVQCPKRIAQEPLNCISHLPPSILIFLKPL